MAQLNETEQAMFNSIKYKLEYYDIRDKDGNKLTIRDCLQYARGMYVKAHYNDGSPDEIIDIGIEKFLYMNSPLLFIEKYGTFDLPGQGTLSCKDLYYFQKEILKDFRYWKTIVLTKSRQVGLSTLTSLICWWYACLFKKEWINIVSKDRKAAQEFLSKIKTNFRNIPEWLNLKFVKNNSESVEFTNGSKVYAYARTKDSGRGDTPTLVILDEAAFYGTYNLVTGIAASVKASLSKSGGQLFIVSTPNGSAEGSEGRWYYEQVRDLQECGGTDGDRRLYDVAWWEVPDYPTIFPHKGYNDKLDSFIKRKYWSNPDVRKEANDYFMEIARKHWEDNPWLKDQRKVLGKVKYLQEILQNFVITGDAVFSDEIIEKTYNEIQKPISKDMLGDRPLKDLWIWKEPDPTHNYILSADIAKGSGDDSSCIQVIDMSTGDQCAEYSGKCTTIDLAHYIERIGKYYNWAFAVIECNSIGEATFSELYYNLNYPNLYRQKKMKGENVVVTGWITNVKSRELITTKFIDFYYDEEMHKTYHPYSERLLSQMKYWVWKGGRPDHSGSTHDDNIMAMAIGLYNIAEGIKNIRKDTDLAFVDESGLEINATVMETHQLTKHYLSTKDGKGKDMDENLYKKMEEQMYKNAGLDPHDPSSAENLKWLFS